MEKIIPDRFCFLSGSALKLIAIITMFIDHIGYALVENGILIPAIHQGINIWNEPGFYHNIYILDRVLRGIGRIAFPIFCFLLIEGFIHTSNRLKYTLRLFAFSIFSEIPFDLAFNETFFEWSYQNVFFTLGIGLLVIWGWEYFERKIYIQLPILAIGCAAAHYVFQCDYGYRGVILIFLLYLFRHYKILQTTAGCASLYWEPWAMFAFIPINFYNGKRGFSMKYFFYIFYPAHLLILYLARILIFQ
ncbi:MAG: TraX family protein [Lachnospiraceae bacterium]|nr:TraX family protein [Lachnospiraceae bacterium]MDD3615048.1 TraX family protein [Lachnospiraceae bacterium]